MTDKKKKKKPPYRPSLAQEQTNSKPSRRYTQEEIMETIKLEGGCISRAARHLGYKTSSSLYNLLKKIPNGLETVQNEYRQNAIALAKEGVMHHLAQYDKDMIKYVLDRIDKDGIFSIATGIQVNIQNNINASVAEEQIEEFKNLLLDQVNRASLKEKDNNDNQHNDHKDTIDVTPSN